MALVKKDPLLAARAMGNVATDFKDTDPSTVGEGSLWSVHADMATNSSSNPKTLFFVINVLCFIEVNI